MTTLFVAMDHNYGLLASDTRTTYNINSEQFGDFTITEDRPVGKVFAIGPEILIATSGNRDNNLDYFQQLLSDLDGLTPRKVAENFISFNEANYQFYNSKNFAFVLGKESGNLVFYSLFSKDGGPYQINKTFAEHNKRRAATTARLPAGWPEIIKNMTYKQAAAKAIQMASENPENCSSAIPYAWILPRDGKVYRIL